MQSLKKVFTFTFVGIGVIALVAVAAPFASAESTETTMTSQAPRCTVAKARLTARTTSFETANTARIRAYTQLQTDYDAVIERAANTTYDTAALKAAQTAIDEKLDAYTTAAAEYVRTLATAKDTACADTDTPFTTALSAARTALSEVRTANLATRTTFREQAIPALKDYAEWVRTQEGGAN